MSLDTSVRSDLDLLPRDHPRSVHRAKFPGRRNGCLRPCFLAPSSREGIDIPGLLRHESRSDIEVAPDLLVSEMEVVVSSRRTATRQHNDRSVRIHDARTSSRGSPRLPMSPAWRTVVGLRTLNCGEVLISLTMTVKLLVALRGGDPSSITTT